MRDMRDDTRTTWRTDDDRDFDQGYFDEPTGQWGAEGTRYGQPGYGYGQGSPNYQGGYGYPGYQGSQGYQGGQGYQGSQGRGGFGRRHGYQGQGQFGQFGQGQFGQGQYGHGSYGQGSFKRGDWRREEFGQSGAGFGTGSDYGQGSLGRSWAEQQGPFAGRGPKGYRRSDDRIREDVSDRLTDEQWLDASDIDVRVEAGMVTLSGTVKSRDDKRRAEDLVMTISGVKDVINQIHVDQGLLDQLTEAVTGEKETTRTGSPAGTRR